MLTIYLTFNGNCQEALNMYEEVFQTTNSGIMRFSDMPPSENFVIEYPEMIMHSEIEVNGGKLLMSDNIELNTVIGDNMTINYATKDESELRGIWDRFTEQGAHVEMELEPSFFAPLFGILTDRFGIQWMLMIDGE